MNIVIYDKKTLKCVGSVADSMTLVEEIELNVIPNFGGSIEDYATIETEKTKFHLEMIDGKVTIANNPVIELQQTQEDYLVDIDFRVTKIEMGV